MIKVFLGEHTQLAKKELNKAIEILSHGADPVITRFSDLNFERQAANEALYAQSLFGGQNIVVCEEISAHPDAGEFYGKHLSFAPNHLLIREIALKKDVLQGLADAGAEISEFSLTIRPKKEGHFTFGETVVSRDKKRGWEEFVRAKEKGAAAEELHGVLFWAMKTVALCGKLDKESAIKAGVNPNNYARYAGHAKKYLSSEIDERLREIKEMSHRAHRGDGDLDIFLEQYVLRR